MSFEEILQIFKPFLYLLPVAILVVVAIILCKTIKKDSVKGMLSYMKKEGLTEEVKRNYLARYLTRTSNRDLIEHQRNCPICGKKFSIKGIEKNSRGDIVDKWNFNCPDCNTVVKLSSADAQYRKFIEISRVATNSPNEERYQEVYATVCDYINYYRPYLDSTPDSLLDFF